jgi:hypothetical protein
MRRGLVLVMAVVVLGMLLLACTGVEEGGGGGSTPAAPKTGMQAIEANEAAGATPDCSKYPVWMECGGN